MAKAVCVFKLHGQSEVLDLSICLFNELGKVANVLGKPLTSVLARACAKYGVSEEAVERYLIEDFKRPEPQS